MTSFKSAQLIASSKDAEKVVFLMDRIELGTQSLNEYRAFAEDHEQVQDTGDTRSLIAKLKSLNPADTLIVTSIQKMSNIKDEGNGLNAADIAMINDKRVVFIVDEAHRSTFGDMLITIKHTFSNAVFFGFTGTPIHKENQKNKNTTATVFGNELHRYSIADGIRDGNVLTFDPTKVLTYKDYDLRKVVALKMANAKTEEEAIKDPVKSAKYYEYMDSTRIQMAGHQGKDGKYVKGIEDHIPREQYELEEHRQAVLQDISDHWIHLSHNSKFHGIFATSSIPEAIAYYRLLKKERPDLNITALFDPNIDNDGGVVFKQDGLVEILRDYNLKYEMDFTLATHDKFKKDISARLAHKRPYERVDRTPEKTIDLLIVVDQMLTGFDSKWVNTLYLDKVLKYENIIQAFSRTNRLFGHEKPFGSIRYYRYPNSMERNVEDAVALYSGNKPLGLFVEHLDYNLKKLNEIYADILYLFKTLANIEGFSRLPDDRDECGRFAKLFGELNDYLEAAKIQGFTWTQKVYDFDPPTERVVVDMDEHTYLILALRYKELFTEANGGGGGRVPFELDTYLVAIDTGRIDTDYMNSRFEKYLKVLREDHIDLVQLQITLDELHKSFATLTQEEQKYANIFIHDVQSGDVTIVEGKSFREYVTDYQFHAKNHEMQKLVDALGLDAQKLEILLNMGVSEASINEFGRFKDLKSTVVIERAQEFFLEREGTKPSPFAVKKKVDKMLRDYILKGIVNFNEDETE